MHHHQQQQQQHHQHQPRPHHHQHSSQRIYHSPHWLQHPLTGLAQSDNNDDDEEVEDDDEIDEVENDDGEQQQQEEEEEQHQHQHQQHPHQQHQQQLVDGLSGYQRGGGGEDGEESSMLLVEMERKEVILLGKEKISNGMPGSIGLGLDAWTDSSQEPYRGFILRYEGTEGGPDEIDTLARKMHQLASHYKNSGEESSRPS